jgi:hypothetical protein
MYTASLGKGKFKQSLQNSGIEDVKSWVALLVPSFFDEIDWDKLEEGDTVTIDELKISPVSVEKPEQDVPVREEL